ncbi:uncharacterized protein EV422DRAFT_161675 [Fimicolochytrium jonesii]|uniref:uncharacterized protein n=1 Tax=Fimicolochytrium jonesii TaxID=1396493 RepID=UPI0022FE6F38|nr:uncharacterized protein EV422DRAFT_161675 [Fimicolochytrium jonesii]KAI8818673.1 hypothetical protein EV422DRAFT_161675 [Fimicolochytrium jonesii]
MNEISGDSFVRTLATHFRESGAAVLDAARKAVSRLDQTSELDVRADHGPPSGRAATQSVPTSAFASYFSAAIGLGTTTPTAKGRTYATFTSPSGDYTALAMDPYHLEYLGSLFQESPLVREYISDSRVNGLVPNILSAQPSGQSNSTSSYLTFLWSQSTHEGPPAPTTTVDEDVLYLYKFFAALPALRIAPVRRNRITGFQPSSQLSSVDLSPFHELVSLEFDAVHPNVVCAWGEVRTRLRALSCRYVLKNAEDLVIAFQESIRKPSIYDPDAPDAADVDDGVQVFFPVLTHLTLAGNFLSEIPISLISHMPQCAYLNLSSNALSVVPPALSALAELLVVDLSGNRITSIAEAGDELRNVTILLLQSNALENLLGVESLARLQCLDVSDNKIWDVYEVGRLAVLMEVKEIWIADNPLTKLPSFRTNIFTYFKDRAFGLLLDGNLPSNVEQKAVQANMTVAAEAASSRTSPHVKSSGGKTRSTVSKDASAREGDRKSTTSGKRSAKSTADKEERQKRRERKAAKALSQQAREEGGTTAAEPVSKVTIPEQPEQAAGDHTSGLEIRPSGPTTAKVPRRTRLAELENSVDPNGGRAGTDILVSRGLKKKTKPKVPKNAKVAKEVATGPSVDALDTPNSSHASIAESPFGETPASSTPTSIAASGAPSPAISRRTSQPKPSDLGSKSDVQNKEAETTTTVEPRHPDIPHALPPMPPPVADGSFSGGSLDHVVSLIAVPQLFTAPPILPPPLPQPPAVPPGGLIETIGPYRRIFQFDASVDSRSAKSSSSNVKWVFPSNGMDRRAELKAGRSARPSFRRRVSSGPDVEVGRQEDFEGVESSPIQERKGSQDKVGILDDASLPALRVGTAEPAAECKRKDQLTRSQELRPPSPPALVLARPLRSNFTGSVTASTRSGGRSNLTAPAYTRISQESLSGSVVGSAITWASMPSWMRPGQATDTNMIPSAPTLPFTTLTNDLKLYLMMHIVKDQSKEKCLLWVPASCVVQLPPDTIADSGKPKGWFYSATKEQERWRTPDYLPAQRPCYLLITNFRLYIFEPKFRFPFVGRSGSHSQDTRYDTDISSLIRLLRCIRLTALSRVDVGLNRQSTVLRYYVRGSVAPSGQSAIHESLHWMEPGGVSPYADKGSKGYWESVNIITRDKVTTTAFLDILAENHAKLLQNEDKGSQSSLNGDVDAQYLDHFVNEHPHWVVDGIADKVLLRKSQRRFTKPSSWAPRTPSHSQTLHTSSPGAWYRRLLRGPQPAAPAQTNGARPSDADKKMAGDLLKEEDEDPAVVQPPDSPPSTIGLYLLVGLIIGESGDHTDSSRPISVRPLSLAATKDFLYLFTERHDIWPPLLFPPECHTPPWVNEVIHKRVAAAHTNGRPQNMKGILADAVSMVSHVIDIAKLRDIIRCERWRTWRWTNAGAGEGAIVQNGYIGSWRKGKRRDYGAGRLPDWGWSAEGECVEGSTAGWSWWVRVVFRDPIPPPSSQSDGQTPQDGPNPAMAALPRRPPSAIDMGESNNCYWDLVFGSLDSANEFIQFLRETRGSRSGFDLDLAVPEASITFDSAHSAESNDSSSHPHQDDSGIEFIIGDD